MELSIPKTEFFSCTKILNLMVTLGFMANYMLRVNLSIAMVDMFEKNKTDQIQNIKTNEIQNITMNQFQNITMNQFQNITTNDINVTRFNWDVVQKNELLGSFFWGYILPDIIGGRLSEILGPRYIFGGGMLLGSIVTVIMPQACYLHFYLAVLLRFILGIALGVSYPSIPPLAVKWIPPSNRSKFMANMMSQGLGTALTLPFCGYLISIYGWPSAFYFTGLLGLLWCAAWFYLVYDSPAQHPRISRKEKELIETEILNSAGGKKIKPKSVPKMKMFLSLPVWSIIVAHGFVAFVQFVNITQLPTYLRDVLHFDKKYVGILSGFPNLGQYILAIISGIIGDKIIKSGRLSTVATRKLFVVFTFLIPGALMIILPIWGQNKIVSAAVFIPAFALIGCMSAGHLPNGLDIAPNFSGTIMGLATTLASIAGWASTKTVALLTKNDNSFENWKNVFYIMIAVNFIGGLFFIVFGKAELQEWNFEQENSDEKDENSPLKATNTTSKV